MTITTIIDSLSSHRFSTYQLPVLGGMTKEECLGIYLWNKQLASAFFPALQIMKSLYVTPFIKDISVMKR